MGDRASADALRWNLDLALDLRGRTWPVCPVAPAGCWSAAARERSQSAGDPHLVSLLAELRGHERQGAEELKQRKTHVEERKVIDASPAAISLARICDPGKDRGDGAEGVGAATGIGTGAEGLSMSAVSLRQQLFTVWKCHHSRRYGHRPL